MNGHAITLALVTFAVLIYAGLWCYLTRENTRRATNLANDAIPDMAEEEIAESGDKSPRFVYTT